ncbi:phosphotransferase [Peribacillus loiseleuriae]|uniref:phosphotransferase n=1 Tax=Peribacillus loiseleuriae TaxID=1679170 RepID=UPI0038178433
MTKTLRLLIPQWQGGNNPAYFLGAHLLNWLAPNTNDIQEEVPVALIEDGLEVEKGIFARRTLLKQIHDTSYPLKEYMWSDDVLIEIAKMLRLYHDSVSDFPFDVSWQSIENTPQQFEVLCHNDFAIYNIIFKHERPIGIIDFDVAGPGTRLWDIAYTLYNCVPLSRFYLSETGEKVYYNLLQDANRIKQRVRLFFASYGEGIEEEYLEMVLLRLEGLCKTITRKANEGDIAFQKMIDEGHLEHYQNDIKFILKHGIEWI